MEPLALTAELLKRITIDVDNKLIKYTCQLHRMLPGESLPSPSGSGVLAQLRGQYFILSASHVLDKDMMERRKDTSLYIFIEDGFHAIPGMSMNSPHEPANEIDLSCYLIRPDIARKLIKSYEFLTIEKIVTSIELVNTPQYCVLGYREENTRIEKESYYAQPSMYLLKPSSDKVYTNYKISKSNSILLEMRGKGSDMKKGGEKKFSGSFYGLSGGGLWFVDISKKDTEVVLDYFLIGIMTQFNKGKFYYLKGDRIGPLIERIFRLPIDSIMQRLI